MSRNRQYRINQKKKKVAHKKRILKEIFFFKEEDLTDKNLGKLNKGKVHCSCAICSTKRAVHGPKVKEKNKWMEMKKEMQEDGKMD